MPQFRHYLAQLQPERALFHITADILMANPAKKVSGKLLNDLWGVSAAHALYREDGRWYHQLQRFPGALFDSNGYVLFHTEEEYRSSPYLQLTQDLHVDRGIAAIPGYVRISESGSLAEFSAHVHEIRRTSLTEKELAEDLVELGPTAPTLRAADIEEGDEAERVLTQIYRILRDTRVARWVKFVHEYRCQICDTAIRLPDLLYAEAHHVRPLGGGHRGPDVIENVLCVCPNHHAELDYGAISLDEAKIRTVRGHYLGPEFVEYHNRFIFRRGKAGAG